MTAMGILAGDRAGAVKNKAAHYNFLEGWACHKRYRTEDRQSGHFRWPAAAFDGGGGRTGHPRLACGPRGTLS